MDTMSTLFFIFVLLLVLGNGGQTSIKQPWYMGGDADSTDKINWTDLNNPTVEKRSGLSVFIDYGTGNHYIRVGLFGGLTPRLDSKGNIFNEYKESQ